LHGIFSIEKIIIVKEALTRVFSMSIMSLQERKEKLRTLEQPSPD